MLIDDLDSLADALRDHAPQADGARVLIGPDHVTVMRLFDWVGVQTLPARTNTSWGRSTIDTEEKLRRWMADWQLLDRLDDLVYRPYGDDLLLIELDDRWVYLHLSTLLDAIRGARVDELLTSISVGALDLGECLFAPRSV